MRARACGRLCVCARGSGCRCGAGAGAGQGQSQARPRFGRGLAPGALALLAIPLLARSRAGDRIRSVHHSASDLHRARDRARHRQQHHASNALGQPRGEALDAVLLRAHHRHRHQTHCTCQCASSDALEATAHAAYRVLGPLHEATHHLVHRLLARGAGWRLSASGQGVAQLECGLAPPRPLRPALPGTSQHPPRAARAPCYPPACPLCARRCSSS